MAITRIPAAYRLGFAKIKDLSPSDTEALVAALQKAPATGGVKEAISEVSKQMPSLSQDEIGDVVRTLYSLYLLRLDDDTQLSEFVSNLTTAMRATGKELALSDIEKTEFQSKITKLLSINTVTIASKVGQLKVEYPYTFQDARVVTDIRPLFAQPEDRPIGAAITHTLKIEYHDEANEHRGFYLLLEAEDLQKLKKVLDRAETKATSLRSLLKTMNLPDLS